MQRLQSIVILLLTLSFSSPTWAQTQQEIQIPTTPANQATTRLPKCLQYPDSKTYVPCTGVVPVDKSTGDVLDWRDVMKASPGNPVNSAPVVNNSPVSSDNPLPVTCTNCAGGSGGISAGSNRRRMFWNDSDTPLSAGQQLIGNTHDNGGTTQGTASEWASFTCFVISDQAGTVTMQASNDGATWFLVQSRTMSPSTPIYINQGMFTKYWRCNVMNGNTDQTSLVVNSSFGT